MEAVTFNIDMPTLYPKDEWCYKIEVNDHKLVIKER